MEALSNAPLRSRSGTSSPHSSTAEKCVTILHGQLHGQKEQSLNLGWILRHGLSFH